MFSLNYILFAYSATTFNGSTFALRNPFLTKWNAEGGMSGLGPVTDIERSIIGLNSVTATVQTYQNGAIYSITSGSLNGSVFAVMSPIYSIYASNGADGGFLGLPTSDDAPLTGSSTTHQQSFQGGNLDYTETPGQVSIPVLAVPVASVTIQPYSSSAFKLTQGQTLPLTAGPHSPPTAATFPAVWLPGSSTNSKVVSIAANGAERHVRGSDGGGRGHGTQITAISEGQVSPSLTITVTAIC